MFCMWCRGPPVVRPMCSPFIKYCVRIRFRKLRKFTSLISFGTFLKPNWDTVRLSLGWARLSLDDDESLVIFGFDSSGKVSSKLTQDHVPVKLGGWGWPYQTSRSLTLPQQTHRCLVARWRITATLDSSLKLVLRLQYLHAPALISLTSVF